jgi:hypothetical protein
MIKSLFLDSLDGVSCRSCHFFSNCSEVIPETLSLFDSPRLTTTTGRLPSVPCASVPFISSAIVFIDLFSSKISVQNAGDDDFRSFLIDAVEADVQFPARRFIARTSRRTRRSMSSIAQLYLTLRTSLNVYAPDISNVYDTSFFALELGNLF